MDQPNAKKPGKKKKAGKRKNLFERNPRKTLVFTAVLFIIILDILAGALFIPADHSFRCSSPYYHHDFLPNRNVETAWGPRKYRVFTNSLGFRDGSVRDVPLASKQKRILLMGDSFIEGMGVSYKEQRGGHPRGVAEVRCNRGVECRRPQLQPQAVLPQDAVSDRAEASRL